MFDTLCRWWLCLTLCTGNFDICAGDEEQSTTASTNGVHTDSEASSSDLETNSADEARLR